MKMFKSLKSIAPKVVSSTVSGLLLLSTCPFAMAAPTTIPKGGLEQSTEIKGYQTEFTHTYSANVEWGKMTFVYDRGNYDPSIGLKTRASAADEFTGAEAGRGTKTEVNSTQYEQVNCWYGFDGTNNLVRIENISTDAITVTATTSSADASIIGDTKFQLYFKDGVVWKDSTGVDTTVATFENVNHNTDVTMKTYGQGASMKTAIVAKEFDSAGKPTDDTDTNNSTEFYLNLTGAPGASISKDKAAMSTLGQITLNFAQGNTIIATP